MEIPSGLGERGLTLWEELKAGNAANDALALEAARLADRLDELDSIIHGKGVLNLMQFRVLNREFEDNGDLSINVEVKFQNVLSEARQQQLALANVLSKISPAAPAKASGQPASGQPLPDGVSPIDRARKAAGK